MKVFILTIEEATEVGCFSCGNDVGYTYNRIIAIYTNKKVAEAVGELERAKRHESSFEVEEMELDPAPLRPEI